MKKQYNKRTSNTESLDTIIGNVLKAQNLEEPYNNKRAEEAWKKVAGSAFLKYTTAVRAKKGILYLSLSSSIVRNELMMAKKFIIKNINEELRGDIIKDIVFG